MNASPGSGAQLGDQLAAGALLDRRRTRPGPSPSQLQLVVDVDDRDARGRAAAGASPCRHAAPEGGGGRASASSWSKWLNTSMTSRASFIGGACLRAGGAGAHVDEHLAVLRRLAAGDSASASGRAPPAHGSARRSSAGSTAGALAWTVLTASGIFFPLRSGTVASACPRDPARR